MYCPQGAPGSEVDPFPTEIPSWDGSWLPGNRSRPRGSSTSFPADTPGIPAGALGFTPNITGFSTTTFGLPVNSSNLTAGFTGGFPSRCTNKPHRPLGTDDYSITSLVSLSLTSTSGTLTGLPLSSFGSEATPYSSLPAYETSSTALETDSTSIAAESSSPTDTASSSIPVLDVITAVVQVSVLGIVASENITITNSATSTVDSTLTAAYSSTWPGSNMTFSYRSNGDGALAAVTVSDSGAPFVGSSPFSRMAYIVLAGAASCLAYIV
jgi:hypothetical protein